MHKPLFWAAFTVFAVACGAFATVNFPRAFSIVELDLRMDRAAALSEARRLGDELGWGPSGYRQAASFRVDERVRNFVELEGGGPAAFAQLVAAGPFHPYQWVVRHFRGGEVREVEVRFRTDGTPYGFRERLSEDAAGAALDPDAARAIAENGTRAPWNVALDCYQPVEAARQERPGGRVDHIFVYERTDMHAGEGRFRLRLVVSGDRLTELTHLLQVPEAFDRRYEEMRSANEGISIAGSFAMLLIYGVGGIGVGLFVLLRQWRVLWRMPLVWGASIAFAQLLTEINRWPLLWMGYDTATSETGFAIQHVTTQVAMFLGFTAVLTLSFMAAESLSRRAFPEHLQFWRVWSLEGARSSTVLGHTVAGYLIVGVDLAFLVTFYRLTTGHVGWWSPSDVLVNPDSLATVLPWLGPLAISLQAGFWEECLFRAVPLAAAALIGDRFGNRRTWIAAAFVLQVVIFGAVHAGYPTQPSYARLIELIVPSTIFGLLYLRFGLLPAIVMHFAFNAVLFSIPLAVSSAPGAVVNQAIFALIFLTPLWVVLAARYRGGSWIEAPSALRNEAWTPPPPEASVEAKPVPRRKTAGLPLPMVVAVGLTGFGLFAYAAAVPSESPPLEVGRAEAVVAARHVLASQAIDPEQWTESSRVTSGLNLQHRFIWTEAGKERYRALLGEYLTGPRWRIRYAHFEGDVAARAEEYIVWVGPDGVVQRQQHRSAENAAGAALSEEEARALARQALAGTGTAADLFEVSATQSRQPARTDWTFTFRDETVGDLAGGEARVAVEIAGDEVVDTRRNVFLPEEWRRADEQRRTMLSIADIASGIVMGLLLVLGAILAVGRWTRGALNLRIALAVAGIRLVVAVAAIVSSWPMLLSDLSTAQPLPLQLGINTVGGLIGAGLIAAVLGLLAGHTAVLATGGSASDRSAEVWTGLAVGLGFHGVLALAETVLGDSLPPWSAYGGASAPAPWLAAAIRPVQEYLLLAPVALLVVTLANTLTGYWTRRQVTAGIALVLIGALLAPGTAPDDLLSFAVLGLLSGALLVGTYLFVLRDCPALVVLAAAAMTVPNVLDRGLDQPYDGALLGSLLGATAVSYIAWRWFAHLRDTDEKNSDASQVCAPTKASDAEVNPVSEAAP